MLSAIPVPDPSVETAREPIVYDPTDEIDGRDREMVEIAPEHFVWAAEDEIEMYKQRAREAGLID